MGDPKVQRSGDGFFTRFGRAVDAFGKDDMRSGKPAAKEAKAVELKPLPGKYKSTPRRLDRSVVSASESVTNKIKTNDEYVREALKLADDMRALAVKEDHWYNNVTPKDVDAVANRYRPLIEAATSPNALEKSNIRYQLAYRMLTELVATRADRQTDWSDLMKINSQLLVCSQKTSYTPCWNGDSVQLKVTYCKIGGSEPNLFEADTYGSCPSKPQPTAPQSSYHGRGEPGPDYEDRPKYHGR